MKLFNLFFLSISIFSCGSEKTLDEIQEKIDKKFIKSNQIPSVKSFRVGERNLISYEVGAKDKDIVVIFLHGSPGSGSDYYDYLKDVDLLDKAYLVTIDRPGYGNSDYGKSLPNVKDQSSVIASMIREKFKNKKLYFIGYSFGGPVAAVLASEFREQTIGMLLVSSSIEPGAEKIFNISYVANFDNVKNKIPTVLRLANDEKLSHKKSLEEIKDNLSLIKCPVKIVHGTKDNLIYFSNADYSKRMMNNASVTIIPMEGEGHGYIFGAFKEIKAHILSMI